MTHEMKTISLTKADIELITYALRKFSETTMFQTLKDESNELLQFIKNQTDDSKTSKEAAVS